MIIKYEHISSAKTIAANIDETTLTSHIKEVETLWVIPAFTPIVYHKIEQSSESFQVLLSGGYYNENNSYLAGLIQAVSYLAYSRFVKDQQINVTAFGVVVKNSQFSEPASDALILKNSKDAERIGLEYLKQCVDYLKANGEIGVKSPIKRKFKAIGD